MRRRDPKNDFRFAFVLSVLADAFVRADDESRRRSAVDCAFSLFFAAGRFVEVAGVAGADAVT